MALVIEDGSIVAGADSFATVAELRAYATKRGASVPADDAACEVLLIKGCDYISAQEPRFTGSRVSADQALPFPRYGLTVNGYAFPFDAIPEQVKSAQMALAIEAQTNDLMPTRLPGDAGAITAEKVGPLEVQYANPVNASNYPRFAKVDGLLAVFYQGQGLNMRVVRA